MSQPEQFLTPSQPVTPGQPAESIPPKGSRARGILTKGMDRRTVIRGAGIAGAGAVGAASLTACGSSDTPTPAVSPGRPPASPAGSAAPVGGAIKVAEIPVGGGKVFDTEKIVVTQPKAGEFKAFSATCTHKGCTVAKVEDGTIDCPCHGSKFDITTGAVKDGPAPAPLPPRTAAVDGDSITLS